MALKMEEKDDAANDFWTASKAYKLSNPERKHPFLSLLESVVWREIERADERVNSCGCEFTKDDSIV